ncbi:hypothetical protein ACHQM5_010760 [Ranunculus cassubicifolius]
MAAIVFDTASLTTAIENDILNFKNKKDGSALSEAARRGLLDCCEVIFERCPQLFLETNNVGATALHYAASKGHVDIINFLIQQTDGHILLMMETKYEYTALHYAAENGQLGAVKALIAADTSSGNDLLKKITEDGNTALHFAVKRCHLEVIEYLVERDPDYEYPSNTDGHTPLFMAWNKASLEKDDPVNVIVRKLMVKLQPKQCAIPSGANKWTLLHYAAQHGDIDAVNEIIESSPECLLAVDNQGQNFVHTAACNKQEQLIYHIVGSNRIPNNVLNAKDVNGKTPFHMATSTGAEGIILALLYSSRVDNTVRDKDGNLATAAIHFEYDKMRAGVRNDNNLMTEKVLKDQSAFDLLVAALICTVSFTSGVMVPGGFTSDGHAILYKRISFLVFAGFNSIAFSLSLYAVFSHFCIKQLDDTKDIRFQLGLSTKCIFGSMFALMASFISGSFAVFGVHHTAATIVCIACFVCFFLPAALSIWFMTRKKRHKYFGCLSRQAASNGLMHTSP